MAYNQTVTSVLRNDRYTTSGFDLMNRLSHDFAGRSSDLSGMLGISRSTASRILAGKTWPNMHRLAYHYGFMPDETASGWRVLPMREEPFDAGPPLSWDTRLVEYLRQVFSNPVHRPAVKLLAWRMDSTEGRLRDAMRRHGIRLGESKQMGGRTASLRTRPAGPKSEQRAGR